LFSCNEEKKEKLEENPATVYYNGDIITMERDSPQYAEALAADCGYLNFL